MSRAPTALPLAPPFGLNFDGRCVNCGYSSAGVRALEMDATVGPAVVGTLTTPGERVGFQCWYRDLVQLQPTSNFSGAVLVGFESHPRREPGSSLR